MAGLAPLLACGTTSDSGAAQLRLVGDGELGWSVELTGLGGADLDVLAAAEPESRATMLAVYTAEVSGAAAIAPTRPAVIGRVEAEGTVARWHPAYPLVAGESYLAVWWGSDPGAAPLLTLGFTLPGADIDPSTVVTAIYPSTDEVPANLLRLYLQFSAPMSRDQAVEHIEVLADGEVVEGAFVVPQQELWSPAGDRLTLFFDPGRLKLEVGPNLEIGAPCGRERKS